MALLQNLSTSLQYIGLCPERLSKPVLRTLGNVIKSRNTNHKKLELLLQINKEQYTKQKKRKKKNTKKQQNQTQVV